MLQSSSLAEILISPQIEEEDSDEDSDDDVPARRAPTGPKKKGEAEKAEECKNQ